MDQGRAVVLSVFKCLEPKLWTGHGLAEETSRDEFKPTVNLTWRLLQAGSPALDGAIKDWSYWTKTIIGLLRDTFRSPKFGL